MIFTFWTAQQGSAIRKLARVPWLRANEHVAITSVNLTPVLSCPGRNWKSNTLNSGIDFSHCAMTMKTHAKAIIGQKLKQRHERWHQAIFPNPCSHPENFYTRPKVISRRARTRISLLNYRLEKGPACNDSKCCETDRD